MADDEPKIELGPNEVALVSACAFVDRDGDPVAVIIIGGITYARLEPTLEEGMKTTVYVMDVLKRFQASSTARIVEHRAGTPRDPSKEN